MFVIFAQLKIIYESSQTDNVDQLYDDYIIFKELLMDKILKDYDDKGTI